MFSNSDDEGASGFNINKNYAQRYNTWREKEEFQKLKDKYGNVDLKEGSEESSSEEDDECAEALTKNVETGFFRVLSCLKRDDPRIYDRNFTFYQQEEEKEAEGEGEKKKSKKPKEKPLLLKDHEVDLAQQGGEISDEEGKVLKETTKSLSYYEKQDEIKKSFEAALESSSESEDEFLMQKTKSKQQEKQEKEDHIEWLKGQRADVNDELLKRDAGYLRSYWNNSNLNESEKFLRDYLLNRRYLENDEDEDVMSESEQPPRMATTGRRETRDEGGEDLSEEEKQIEQQEEFERKYNFRFEEPDPEFIKSYPRLIKDSVRHKDDRRKRKREEIRERKLEEKDQKKEEIRRLKALKRKEILEKLEQLKKITGNSELGVNEDDLLEEFDPDEHDKKMKQMFSENYYGVEEDDQKPVFEYDPKIDDDTENWDAWERDEEKDDPDGEKTKGKRAKKTSKGADNEDVDLMMDCDYDPSNPRANEDEAALSKKKRRRQRKSKFAEIVEKQKPVYNPGEKTFDQYLDEYYQLDCEDMIGDLRCRFKYRSVVPNDFGLSVDEILMAKDTELNSWASLKKCVQYRTKEEELYDVKAFQAKAKNVAKKAQTLTTVFSEKPDEEEQDVEQKEQKEQKEEDVQEGDESAEQKKKRRRKKKRRAAEEGDEVGKDEEKTAERSEQKEEEVEEQSEQPEQPVRKKHKKHKHEEQPEQPVQKKQKQAEQSEQPVKKKHKHHKRQFTDNLGVTDERLKAYGLNPKKFKDKMKYRKK